MAEWIDYANLGLNIGNMVLNAAQLEQLSAANATLANIAQIEAQREKQAQAENYLRQFIFDEEGKIQQAMDLVGSNPKKALFLAYATERNLETVGVEPARFREFHDKDRTSQVLLKAKETIQYSSSALVPSQLEDVKLAFQYVVEAPQLQKLISALQAEDLLSATKELWEKLRRQYVLKSTIGKAGLVIMLLSLCPLASRMDRLVRQGFAGSATVFIVGVGLLALFVWLAVPDPPYEELKKRREVAQKSCLPTAEMTRLRTFFPPHTTADEYTALLKERGQQVHALLSR